MMADQVQGGAKFVMSYDAAQRKKSPFFALAQFVFANCDKFVAAPLSYVTTPKGRIS
jgi:hypothetical protein